MNEQEQGDSTLEERISILADRSYKRCRKLLKRKEIEVPDELYHYTTVEAFFKIMTPQLEIDAYNKNAIVVRHQNSLHASCIRHLNDSSELEHGLNELRLNYEKYSGWRSLKEKIESTIGQRIPGKRTDDYEKHWEIIPKYIEEYLNMIDEMKNRSFCLSLTEEDNELSQWRAYSNGGDGVRIGLKAKELISDKNWYMWPVIYTKQGKEDHLATVLLTLLDIAEIYKSEYGSYELEDFIDDWEKQIRVANILTGPLLALKHECFAIEKEYRLVNSIILGKSDIKYKLNNNKIVAYCEVEREGKKLPIKSIRTGPCISKQNAISIKDILSNLWYNRGFSIEYIETRDIPLIK